MPLLLAAEVDHMNTHTLSTRTLAAGTQRLQFLPSLAVAMLLLEIYMHMLAYSMVCNKS